MAELKKKSLNGSHHLVRMIALIIKVEEITSGVRKNLLVGDKIEILILIENLIVEM